MKKLPILGIIYALSFFQYETAFGKQFEVSHPYTDKENSGFKRAVPQKLIIDQDGNVIYNKVGYKADIVRKIKKTPPLQDSPAIIETLKRWMPEGYDFSDAEYTIVLVTVDKGCPPCDKDEQLLTKIHDTLTAKDINFVTIRFVFDSSMKVTVISNE